jgi:FdhE protein
VADSVLSRWFGARQTGSPALDPLRAELDRLAAARPGLLPLAGWLREMLPDLVPSAGVSPPLSGEPERALAKLKAGIPLLRGERLSVDVVAFRRRWQRACEALAVHQGDAVPSGRLADAVRAGRLDPARMVEAVVAGQPEVVRQRSEELELDPGLATTLLRFALFGVFTALEASLGRLRAGVFWERGNCPTCGSWPLLGEFRGLDQSRFLRCGLCAAEWEVPRLWCPYCGNRDHEELSFLSCEGEETKYRASTCDGCRGYVKMVSTLTALPPLNLLVADVATLHLDLAAAERGYVNHF